MASAVVTARIPGATSATMVVDADPVLLARGEPSGDSVWRFSLTDLEPDTAYAYAFLGSPLRGTVRTFPAGSFTVAAGSCMGNSAQYGGPGATSNSPAFDRIRDRAPAVFIQMGDLHYGNIGTNNVAAFRTAYQNVLANSRFAGLVANVPTAYVFDDHDFGANDANGTSASKPAAQQSYREYVPHWPLPGTECHQTFVIGRVRFVILDVRSERTPNGATDNASKTRLGASQKQWLKDTLLAATEPVIVIDVKSYWGNLSGFSDGWVSFATERRELAEFFTANGLTARLFLIGGDIHELSGDDGTNTQFDPASLDPGPPYCGFAPLDASYNHFGGTFSEGVHQVRRQQYGTLDFDDQGNQIVVTAKGWAVTDATEVEVFSLAKSYPA